MQIGKGTIREGLIDAARSLFYHHGYLHTTLAEVAQAAAVPIGNIYYYFKTKDSLLEAVITGYQRQVEEDCARLDHIADPRERLRAFFAIDGATARQVAQFGCPYGTLCQELAKLESPLAESAHRLLQTQIAWVARQLTSLGKGDTAHDLATTLIALQQGWYLMANTYLGPEALMHHLKQLDFWLAAV